MDSTRSNRGKFFTRHDLIATSLVILVAVGALLPIFIKGFPKGEDAAKHYRWSTEFSNALADGALYPRWLPAANKGMGSPTPIYYPPFSFYVAAAFNVISSNMLEAISLSCWLALALSGLAMFAFSRLTLSRPMSLLAATLYMLMPFHLMDLYQGSAIAEFWAFVWIPLVLLFASRMCGDKSDWGAFAGLALCYALLIQTHIVGTVLLSLILPAYALLLTREVRRLARIGAGVLLGAGIGAIFIVPVLFETKYVQIEKVLRHGYGDFFLFENLGEAFKALLHPSRPYEYWVQTNPAALGLSMLLLAGAAAIFRSRAAIAGEMRARLWWAASAVTALSLMMTVRLSTPLWKLIPGLEYLQFPFRWLVVASAGAPLVITAGLSFTAHSGERRVLWVSAILVIVAFNLALDIPAIARMPLRPEAFEEASERRETPEYRPIWWVVRQDAGLKDTSVLVTSGSAAVKAIDDSGIRQVYDVRAETESVLTLRPLFFPGWVARVDGEAVANWPGDTGHIQLEIEPGDHLLMLTFEDTWPRVAGKLISTGSLLLFFGLAVVHWRNNRRTSSRTSSN